MPTRILLVEDNPGDAIIFREKLNASEIDYHLVHVKRLGEGLERLAETEFDLLFVDLSLPDASGLEAVTRVREAAPSLPLIVLTGLDDAAAAAEAKEQGAVDYLVKWYVDSDSLARYIRYAIAQYERYGDKTGNGSEPTREGQVVEGELVIPSSPVAEEPTEEQPPEEQPSEEPETETAPLIQTGAVSDTLIRAAETALAFVRRTEQRSAWMASVLASALDVHRLDAGDLGVQSEKLDVLELAHQVVREEHDLAMKCGLPLRTTSKRKKVIAQGDRNLVTAVIHRAVVDAIHTASADGVEVHVEVERAESVVEVRWYGNGRSDAVVEACLALGGGLVERLAVLNGGTSVRAQDADGRHVVSVRLPGGATE